MWYYHNRRMHRTYSRIVYYILKEVTPMLKILFWPFKAVWHLAGLVFALLGVIFAPILGICLAIAGIVLVFKLVFSLLGVILMVLGGVVLARAIVK